MSQDARRVEDPNLADLPDEAFAPVKEGESVSPLQLEARIRARREQAAQDAGHIESPHHAADIEPIEVSDEGGETVPGEELPQEPPTEQPETPEPPEGEEPEEGEPEEPEGESDADEFFVGRYKTKEDAERAIAEKDATIQRLFQAQAERERQAQQQKPEQQQAQIDVGAWHEWARSTVEEGTVDEIIAAAGQAFETAGQQGFDLLMAHWMQDEDPDSRATAIAFNAEVQRQYAAITALEAIQKQPVQQSANGDANEGEIARSVVASKYPDFAEMQQEMDRLATEPGALDPSTDQWLRGLAAQGVEGKQRAWEYLYLTAAANRSPAKQKAAQIEGQRRRASADADKVAAAVSSSEGSSVRTPLSEAELSVIRKKNGIREKAGLPLLPEE